MRTQADWLASYMKLTERMESPESFHLWTGLLLLAGALGRKVYFDFGFFKTYANLYVLIVAESAQVRKSTASNFGVLELLLPALDDLFVFRGKITNEALVNVLAEHTKRDGGAEVFVYASELRVFITEDASRTGLGATLMNLFDCPDVADAFTLKRGKDRVRNTYVCFLGCTTPTDLPKVFPLDSLQGGLTQRVVFVCAKRRRKNVPLQKPLSAKETELLRSLQLDLQHIHKLAGVARVSPEVEAEYDPWYNAIETQDVPDVLDGFHGRLHTIVLKVALLLSVAQNDSLIVESSHFQRAVKLLEEVEKHAPLAFSRVVPEDSPSAHFDTFWKVFERSREEAYIVLFKTLQNRMSRYWKTSILREQLAVLKRQGKLEEIAAGSELAYRWITPGDY